MTTAFLFPYFSKSEKDKVNNEIDVSSEHVLLKSGGGRSSVPAIASEGFPINRDGTYVFVIFIENGLNTNTGVGFTSTKTISSSKGMVFPGCAEMNGLCTYLDGDLEGGNGDFLSGSNDDLSEKWIKHENLPAAITKKAKEIIAILTISSNGSKRCAQFIFDGNESPVHESASTDFENANGSNEIFPVVILNRATKIEIIPFNQVKSRSPKIDELMKEFLKNNNAKQQPSDVAQLQQELDKERKRADLAESQLDDEKKISRSKISSLEQEVVILKQQLQSFSPASPFVKDKPYQIDFAANGLPIPTDRSTFGALLAVAQTSPIFLEAKKLMRKLGTFYPSQKPVAGFTLEGVDAIAQSASGFDDILFRLQQFRTHGGGIFNPSTTKYSAEQLQVLIYLNKLFLDRPSDAHDKAPDLINVFHGTKRGVLQSAVNGLVAVRSTDAGFFGLGAYTTPNIEYAARYATGEFNPTSTDFTPRADGSFPVIWCVAAVGVCYPLTREKDYGQNKQWNGMGVSDFFGSPLKSDANGKFDCHCVLVNESANYQAVPRDQMQYMEIVFDQTSQVLPIAVLWMKPV